MSYCPKCDIVIRGNKRCCPLCQGKLSDIPKDMEVSDTAYIEAFPVIEKKMSQVTFIKMITFLFLALEICFGMLKWMSGGSTPWASLVMLGLLVGWLDVLGAMYVKGNIIKLMTVEGYVAVAVNCYVDHKTGLHGWSYAWVVPAIIFGLGIVTITVARTAVLRYSEYLQYIALNTGAALLQLIPIRRGYNPLPLPAYIVITCYLILMAAVVVFRSGDLKTALERRLSV